MKEREREVEKEKEKERARKVKERERDKEKEKGKEEKEKGKEEKEKGKEEKEKGSSREKVKEIIVLDASDISKSVETVFESPILTDSQRKSLFLASEIKRISDPFLVFDSDGMQVQDPPDYYSADCLGNKILRK